jgi:hypothetical protein
MLTPLPRRATAGQGGANKMIVERKTYRYVNTMAFQRQPLRAFSPVVAPWKLDRYRDMTFPNVEF